MPLYEYVCRDCDYEGEQLLRSSSEQPQCPECEGGELVKMISLPAAPSSDDSGSCGSGCGCC